MGIMPAELCSGQKRDKTAITEHCAIDARLIGHFCEQGCRAETQLVQPYSLFWNTSSACLTCLLLLMQSSQARWATSLPWRLWQSPSGPCSSRPPRTPRATTRSRSKPWTGNTHLHRLKTCAISIEKSKQGSGIRHVADAHDFRWQFFKLLLCCFRP